MPCRSIAYDIAWRTRTSLNGFWSARMEMWLMTLDGNSATLSVGRFSLSVNLTVYLSTASHLSTDLSRGALAWPFVFWKRLIVYTTSSATSSRPLIGGLLCHFTPRRSLNTYVVSFGCVHDSARSGSIAN